jgi:tripartite-type tricarboxylate transporter receptor subunit TctC
MKRIATLSRAIIAAVIATAGAGPAAAQSQQVRIISGFPPGGAVDALARIFAVPLSEALGRPVVVETRAGAAGQISAQAVKASAPDGNTLMVVPDSMITLYPHTVSRPVYDTFADFAPVAHLGGYPIALAVNVNVPAKDLKEYVGWARQAAVNANYGTAGVGTTLHFLGLMIGQATGLPMVHVPYKGVGPAVTDAVAGQIPALIMPLGTLLPQAGPAGKLRILAHSGSRRSEAAPSIPTFREQGFPTVEANGWFALFAPARTPTAVVSRYNDIVVQAIRTPAIREKLRGLDMEPREMTPAEITAQLKLEYDRWGPIVKASGFSADSQ